MGGEIPRFSIGFYYERSTAWAPKADEIRAGGNTKLLKTAHCLNGRLLFTGPHGRSPTLGTGPHARTVYRAVALWGCQCRLEFDRSGAVMSQEVSNSMPQKLKRHPPHENEAFAATHGATRGLPAYVLVTAGIMCHQQTWLALGTHACMRRRDHMTVRTT